MKEVAGIRRFGAASLDLAWVAAGRFDGYWEREVNLWDIAAGSLLVREAGGFIGGLRDGHGPLDGKGLLCANEALFEPLKKTILGA